MLRKRLPTIFVLAACLALLPFAFVFRARATLSALPRVHPIQGMDNQGRFKSQQVNPLFVDAREERPWVANTVARGHLPSDDAVRLGIKDGAWVEAIPLPVNATLLHRGQERFGIYCSPCHGLAGFGDGMVAARADRLQEGTWVPPTSMHDATVLARPVGHIYNTITNGIRTMPSYGPQIPEADRWAIVAYVRALQLSQRAPVALLTQDERAALKEVAK
ncbi:MAG TPA: cytochrome c [Candidatus Polarisedimenticolaceae bacterium]|nr:cytochrome c [Candidatus Polarisedimenticolaceae bacterium]